jgi:hypothetical protein
MPKQGKMFAGITRQVVISDETHQLLSEAAQHENKYMGELADEILRSVLRIGNLKGIFAQRLRERTS